MAIYRELMLINGNNEQWSLSDKEENSFATDLDGFGMSTTISTIRLGDMNYLSYSLNNLDSISLTIYFYGGSIADLYGYYNQFQSFLAEGDLYLIYVVPDIGEFRRPVALSSIGKSEIRVDGLLECPIVFATLGFWEDRAQSSISIANNGTGTIVNNGNMPCPFKIETTGTLSSPKYTFSKSGNAYGVGQFTGSYKGMTVDTGEFAESIILLNSSSAVVTNPYNYQNLSAGSGDEDITFFNIKIGTSSVAMSGVTGTTTITWRNRYVSV